MKARLEQRRIVLGTPIGLKCRLEDCPRQWLPCAIYEDEQVRNPNERAKKTYYVANRTIKENPSQAEDVVDAAASKTRGHRQWYSSTSIERIRRTDWAEGLKEPLANLPTL